MRQRCKVRKRIYQPALGTSAERRHKGYPLQRWNRHGPGKMRDGLAAQLPFTPSDASIILRDTSSLVPAAMPATYYGAYAHNSFG